MPDSTPFFVFLAAATLLAITPGPGIFYVLTRTLQGGRGAGLASTFGTAVGGLGHVVAAALGLSALLATSALAFGFVKYAGAAYLLYLGIRTLRQRNEDQPLDAGPPATLAYGQTFRQGVITEVLNPKTALFFLAFIPHFVDPSRALVPQFVLLGAISVTLNTAADVVVAWVAGPIGLWLQRSTRLRRGQRRATGWALIGLGAYVAVADTGK